MQYFCAFFVSAAKTGFSNKPEKLDIATVPPVSPFRKSLRCNLCSSVLH
jgi:hypothetical protein